ncbi:MAG: SurA N-terminal domain-containing protein [Candidatus Rariloculaceae bacterium]
MLQAMREGIGRWVAVVILGLLAVAFIFWGVDFTLTGSPFAAKVNGTDIPILEFERDLQTQQAQYQELYRIEITDDLQQELRLAVLERLIRNEALLQQVEAAGYRVSDEQLIAAIRERPEFQVGGQFSIDVYRATLLNLGMTQPAFEEIQREQLSLLELQAGIMTSGFYTEEEYIRYVELYNQQREVAYALFPVDDFLPEAVVSDEAIDAYFDSNRAAYYSDESVDIEYIELRGSDIAAQVEYTEDELLSYYESESFRFQTAEERLASHILISLDSDDPESAAAEILARLDAGEDFAALAEELSQDAGTRGQGGDLGYVGRGLLVGPFEDTLFSMAVGDVEGPVETDFGYHIIALNEIRAGEVRTFEDVREELALDFQAQRSEQLFYDQASELADLSFDAFDELASVATQMDVPLQTFEGFTRNGTSSPFADEQSAPVVQAAYSFEVLEQRENSLPVELETDHVLVLRVVDHHPPEEQTLDAVRDEVEQELLRDAARDLAEAAAEAFLAAAPAAEDLEVLAVEYGGTWTPAAFVERTDGDVPTQLLSAAFRSPKPAGGAVVRESVALASGDQAVLLLSAVEPGRVDTIPFEERNAQSAQLAEQSGMVELTGYASEVREAATVRIPDIVLNPVF